MLLFKLLSSWGGTTNQDVLLTKACYCSKLYYYCRASNKEATMYRIVMSRSTCYYSENQKFCFLKSGLLTCRIRTTFIFQRLRGPDYGNHFKGLTLQLQLNHFFAWRNLARDAQLKWHVNLHLKGTNGFCDRMWLSTFESKGLILPNHCLIY